VKSKLENKMTVFKFLVSGCGL